MRPIRIELEGFGAFKQKTVVDFTGIDLVAFVGLTGAGKSTIIDAITFALYGSVARYDKVNLVAPVIHQLTNEAKVSLEFEVAGQTYTATRIIRRQKSENAKKLRAATKEARLEKLLSADETQVIAGSVKELDASVETLLGLNFEQFTRTVVLPQGEFAKFLKDDPADRQKLIRRLLGLEIFSKIGVKARERVKKSKQKIEIYASEQERYKSSDSEYKKNVLKKLKDLGVFEKKAEKLIGGLNKIDEELDPIRDEVKTFDADIVLLNLIAENDIAEQIQSLEIDKFRQELAAANLKLVDLRKDRESKTIDLPEQSLLDLEQALEIHNELKVQSKNLKSDQTQLAKEKKSLEELEAKTNESKSALDKSISELSDLQSHMDASLWREKLVKGEDCPVCEQEVTALPKKVSKTAVSKLETQIQSNRNQFTDLTEKLATAKGRTASLTQEIERTATAISNLETKITEIDDLPLLKKKIEQVKEIQLEVTEVDKQIREQELSISDVQESIAKIEKDEARYLQAFHKLRDSVSHLKPPEVTTGGLNADWGVLQKWVTTQIKEHDINREKLAIKGKTLAEKRGKAVNEISELAATVNLQSHDPADQIAAAKDEETELKKDIAEIEHQESEYKRLTELIANLDVDSKKFDVLGKHLSASGFEGWLLEEALFEISQRASEKLMNLSDGQYSLDVSDRNFLIIDHNNAGETRDVRTLSGGETFLASLALALALSDSIIELTSNNSISLGAIFLDEGFGTLDTETLDVAASAIEELSSTGRMVGVVTHVRELAERLPVRFEVTKGPSSSSIEKVEV